ncbi:MAG: hypothetical protein RIS31_1129, partial [Actinomycetota bacterium]
VDDWDEHESHRQERVRRQGELAE